MHLKFLQFWNILECVALTFQKPPPYIDIFGGCYCKLELKIYALMFGQKNPGPAVWYS